MSQSPSFTHDASLILLHGRRRLQIPLLLQILDNDLDRILHTRLMALDVNLRLGRLLVRRTDTRELGNLPFPGFLIQPLGVPLLRDLDRHINPHLHKRHTSLPTGPLGLVQRARLIAVGAVGGDEARDGDGAAVGEQFGDLGDAADVFLAVLGGEAEVLVEAEADVVAVEAVGGEVVGVSEQGLLEGDGDGGLAGGGEAGEPDC